MYPRGRERWRRAAERPLALTADERRRSGSPWGGPRGARGSAPDERRRRTSRRARHGACVWVESRGAAHGVVAVVVGSGGVGGEVSVSVSVSPAPPHVREQDGSARSSCRLTRISRPAGAWRCSAVNFRPLRKEEEKHTGRGTAGGRGFHLKSSTHIGATKVWSLHRKRTKFENAELAILQGNHDRSAQQNARQARPT